MYHSHCHFPPDHPNHLASVRCFAYFLFHLLPFLQACRRQGYAQLCLFRYLFHNIRLPLSSLWRCRKYAHLQFYRSAPLFVCKFLVLFSSHFSPFLTVAGSRTTIMLSAGLFRTELVPVPWLPSRPLPLLLLIFSLTCLWGFGQKCFLYDDLVRTIFDFGQSITAYLVSLNLYMMALSGGLVVVS